MKKSFGVVGGDKRQQELAALLRRDGHTVFTYGLGEKTPIGLALEAEVIVLPLPLEGKRRSSSFPFLWRGRMDR